MANFTTPPVWYGKEQIKVDMFSGYNSATSINIGTGNDTVGHEFAISIGNNVQNSNYSIGIGIGCEAYGNNSIAIGFGAKVGLNESNKVQLLNNDETNASAYIGDSRLLTTNDIQHKGWPGSVQIGNKVNSKNANSITVGSQIDNDNGICIGKNINSANSVSIGYNINSFGQSCVLIGNNCEIESDEVNNSICIGNGAFAMSSNTVQLLSQTSYGAVLYVGNKKMSSEDYVNASVSTNKSYINILKGRVNDIIDQLVTRFSATNIRDLLIKDTEIPQ